MTTTFSDQIMAIKDAMKEYPQKSPIYECLNDAASSIASLNLTKDLKPKQCFLRNGDHSWELRVDGKEFHFVGSDFAEYLEKHYESLGYVVQFIDQD